MDNRQTPFTAIYRGRVVAGTYCAPDLIAGHPYTVVEVCKDNTKWTAIQGDFYQLKEMGPDNYYHHGLFAPIDEQFKQISLTKVLETETPLVSAN